MKSPHVANNAASTPPPAAGTQTLARGLRALELVSTSASGLSVAEVADALGVHRSIATRLLATLADFHLITRSPEGRYRAGGGLMSLAREVYASLRELTLPAMQQLADDVGSSVALFVAEGSDAVALSVVEPALVLVRVSYREGSRHPLDRGAAGAALSAALPTREADPERVAATRADGYVITHGEVLPGYWGLGVPVAQSAHAPAACLTLINPSRELLESAAPATVRTAEALRDLLAP